MAKPGQYSFRRILLSRLLLLSVPVLLMGVSLTYRKAHSSLQETARQNLTESAIRKGERIRESVEALQANLVIATQTAVLQSGSPQAKKQFLTQLFQKLPSHLDCFQITDLKTKSIIVSTCDRQEIITIPENFWNQTQDKLSPKNFKVHVTALLPDKSAVDSKKITDKTEENERIRLFLSAPIYDSAGNLRSSLSFHSLLLEEQEQGQSEPGSLAGYTVVIDEKGNIIAHPARSRIGGNIADESDEKKLKSLVRNAIAGRSNFLHLFSLEKNGVELLAGYTAIPSPITTDLNRKWIILAVTRRDNALADLSEIRQVLITLTLCLIAASMLATLYLSRTLARPVEELTDYARDLQHLHSKERVPHNFKIKEFNQLAEALDSMVERLKAWAEELETAWKEAQTANKLKNEFLATTSHELRTPLNAIIGCVRLVKDDCCDNREEELDFLQRADDAAIHLLGIINDVLDIAKIESGKLTVITEPVDLQKILKEVIDLQVVAMHQKGLKLKISEPKETLIVRADPAKLKQVLLNVLGNATKFTERGSITITTQLEKNITGWVESKQEYGPNCKLPTAQSNLFSSRVIVTVKDTGIGIDPAQQHKLFRPFVMIDATTTRKFGGTGLGLALSRTLIELMGGQISLYSDGEGKGTTVEIVLSVMEIPLLSVSESNELSTT